MKGIGRYLTFALLATGLLLAALLVLTPHSISRADPRVLYAAPDGATSGNCDRWANACTLQYALSLAQRGDEIWVQAGIHYPSPAGDRTATFALKSGVAIYGGFTGTESSRDARNWRANPTVLSGDIDRNDITDANGVVTTTAHIQGENACHVVTAENVDSTAVLDGFVITAGKADGLCSYSYGGGMYSFLSSPTLANLTFSGNSASDGGGMYNVYYNPTLSNITFSGNSASSGGGMYNSGGNPTLTHVSFSGNSANNGGGMYNSFGSPTLHDVVFDGNFADGDGGGMSSGGNAVLINAVFRNNSGANYGGGMSVWVGSPTLINILFSGNSAEYGGGMSNWGPGTVYPTLINVTFSGNSASTGGGMFNAGSIITLTNAILWGNSAITGTEIYNTSGNVVTISHSDIRGCGSSGSGWNSACGIDGGSNIDADPLFADANTGNLRLQENSPAIDAGNNDAIPADITTDLDGNPRFSGPVVDMGAYEYQHPQPYDYLLVHLTGEGVGQVQSDPTGIACPGTCLYGYPRNTVITLTATAGATSGVSGWNGCDHAAGNTCRLTMTASRTVTVTFSHTPGVLYAAPTARGLGDCSNWDNACTLQTALTSAASGDEIWVEKGVHYPGTIRTATFRLKNGVAVYGGFAGTESSRDARNWQAHPTVLSGDIDRNDITDAHGVVTTTAHITGTNAYRVVTAENVDSTAVLDGFVITAGKADGPYPHSYGGGMYNLYGDPTLTNVTFSGNSAQSYGGGMYNFNGNPTLMDVAFCGNSASGHGGGMYNDGNPTLTDVTFSSNSAYAGGGMSNWYSDPVLLNVIFRDNSASAGGGGMFNSSSSPTLTNVVFSGNSARNGGGMFNDYSNPTVVNATFSGNSATEFGGGMSTYYLYYSPPTLKNVIMWGNSAPTGAEIYRDETCNPIISYSDIRGCGGSSSWNYACGVNSGGNIDADPLFVDAAAGNLRLRAGSPAIDAGLNSAVPPGVTTDLDGNPRFVDFTGRGTAIVDMGAYEVQPLPFRVYLPLVMRNR